MEHILPLELLGKCALQLGQDVRAAARYARACHATREAFEWAAEVGLRSRGIDVRPEKFSSWTQLWLLHTWHHLERAAGSCRYTVQMDWQRAPGTNKEAHYKTSTGRVAVDAMGLIKGRCHVKEVDDDGAVMVLEDGSPHEFDMVLSGKLSTAGPWTIKLTAKLTRNMLFEIYENYFTLNEESAMAGDMMVFAGTYACSTSVLPDYEFAKGTASVSLMWAPSIMPAAPKRTTRHSR